MKGRLRRLRRKKGRKEGCQGRKEGRLSRSGREGKGDGKGKRKDRERKGRGRARKRRKRTKERKGRVKLGKKEGSIVKEGKRG